MEKENWYREVKKENWYRELDGMWRSQKAIKGFLCGSFFFYCFFFIVVLSFSEVTACDGGLFLGGGSAGHPPFALLALPDWVLLRDGSILTYINRV